MIIDLELDEVPESIDTNVCVIGAGAAGIPLGMTLTLRGVDIVMLESGGRSHEPETHRLNDSEVVGLPHVGIHEGRFRGLGGSTTQWGGQILPMHPIDFEHRPWVEWSGWPIPYASLVPYFRSALAFAGLGQAVATDAACDRR